MNAKNINFLCNNVKGLQTSKKRLKVFHYFNNKIFPNGIIFSLETHSTKENEIKWKDKYEGDLYCEETSVQFLLFRFSSIELIIDQCLKKKMDIS